MRGNMAAVLSLKFTRRMEVTLSESTVTSRSKVFSFRSMEEEMCIRDRVFAVFPQKDQSPLVRQARYIAATRALHEYCKHLITRKQ